MRVVLQRSLEAEVRVDGQSVGRIDGGLVALVGIGQDDDHRVVESMADKTLMLRIFADEFGKMNRNIVDVAGEILAISQFTLLADCRKGRRPAFTRAAQPELAKELYEYYVARLAAHGTKVATGVFAADMRVSLINDGPVTLVLDSAEILPQK